MECSFCIWLARNNKEWTPAANCKLNDSSKETYNSESSMSSLKQTTKPGSNAESLRPVGVINKGNTCYANSILQILSVITHPLEQTPFRIQQHLITYVKSHQSQHDHKKEFKKTC